MESTKGTTLGVVGTVSTRKAPCEPLSVVVVVAVPGLWIAGSCSVVNLRDLSLREMIGHGALQVVSSAELPDDAAPILAVKGLQRFVEALVRLS